MFIIFFPKKKSGTTAVCPKNVYQEDGTVCSEISDGYCASGVCTNRVQQCINVGMLYEKPQYNKDCLGSCRLFCESPLEGCRYFPGNFLNGTKCDNGGVCYGGICSSGDVGKFFLFLSSFFFKKIIFYYSNSRRHFGLY